MEINWSKADSFIGNFTSPALVYNRPCPICDSIRSKIVFQLSDFQFFSDSTTLPKRVNIVEHQCMDCFALFLNPCYSSYGFQVLFAEAGQSYGATEGRPIEQAKWLDSRGLLCEGKTILDAGCYDGDFLSNLPNRVKKVGVDIDRPAIERGTRKYAQQEIEFVLGDFESFKYPDQIDTITMFHVLEHLPRPVKVLRNLRTNASSSTHLVLEVPILENGITNDINGFFSVQHMTHFSRNSLRNSLARAGWRVIEWIEQEGYNGCRVLAVPDLETSSVEGDSNDITSLYRYLSAWYQTTSLVSARLAKLQRSKRCIIWGAGAHTEFLYHVTPFFLANPQHEYAIVDSDLLKHNKSWRGLKIYGTEALREVDWSDTNLLISSYGSQDAIIKVALERGVPNDKIAWMYDEVRVY